ncbi:enoyl-CoA hydratase-related protein [Sphingomonas profundi]|uniref:enoyl-CoA hydratase-related protein n=1 Tax=Alterirhizorhabdus profundi TaxID=2681549 RepID=UPI0012E85261|nr:enoyl-CoA hydratase-related protein [Sphingomonas profundi]
MSYENIRLHVADGVARLTLARPAALNALSRALLGEFIDALDVIRGNDAARVLLITGAGRGFSSGADLSSGGSPAGSAGFDAGQVLEEYYNPLIERMFDLPIPIVAGVHGAVAGAGCMIALSADIVVAARSAFFLQAFVNAGLVPDAGSMWLLPRLIGRARAQAMMMLAERLSAEKAAEWGMVYEVVEDDALADRVAAIADRLARGPTRAHALIRRGVRAALDSTLSETLAMERAAQREAGASEDFREGIAAFREKRRPQFTGR